MARGKPVLLGHLQFPTRGQAQEYFSSMLARLEIGTVLTGSDFEDVEALLTGHPSAQDKIGPGIKSLTVEDDTMGYKCFHITKSDGTTDNFSYKKCIYGDAPPFTNFSAACRAAVKPDLHAFKAKYFEKNQDEQFRVTCPETKIKLTFSEAAVDHKVPLCFSVIVNFFIKSKSIDLAAVKYVSEGLYGHIFADSKLTQEFIEWHTKTAQLRVIHPKRNLTRAHLGRIKPTKDDNFLL